MPTSGNSAGGSCGPEEARDCEPIIEIATALEFLLKNRRKAQNFIYGELVGSGELAFLVENLPKDGTGCPGWWMFDMLMQHFGARVTAVQGNWTYGDNLAAVNRLTAAGAMPLEEAARHGPTGRYAATWGFTTVAVLAHTTGSPGNYSRVYVLFKK